MNKDNRQSGLQSFVISVVSFAAIYALASPPVAIGGEVVETEPNNTTPTANSIAPGQFGRGVITYSPGFPLWFAESDFWKTPVQVGDLIFAYEDTHDSTGFKQGSLSIILNDGSPLEADSTDGPPPGLSDSGAAVAGAVASQAGDLYYLASGGLSGGQTSISPYRLYQAIVHPTENNAETEPNDTPATANRLTARMMTGTVTGSEVDFYKVFLQAGQRLVVIMDDNPDDDGTFTDTELSILATDGTTILASGDNVGYGGFAGAGDANAAGAVVAAATGIYYIRVAHGGEANALDTNYRFVVLVDGATVVDRDTDGVPDEIDGCPDDPTKGAPGQCGCGVPDTDTDGDGTADCVDDCPNDPAKIAPGVCGCGVADIDANGNGIADCLDPPSDGGGGGGGSASCGTCGNGAPTMLSIAVLLMWGTRLGRIRRNVIPKGRRDQV